jgi:hypothetical protein
MSARLISTLARAPARAAAARASAVSSISSCFFDLQIDPQPHRGEKHHQIVD